jgi:3-oxoacyl-[acyl-carrier protein] reductase
MDLGLQGRGAVVTGAAHGIGRSICVELVRAGARVVAADLLAEDLAGTAEACRGLAGSVRTRVADAASAADAAALVAAAEADGGIDVLVNCAGGVCGQTFRPIEEVSDADWDAVVSANLTAAFRMIRAAVPAMKRRGGGRIVNINSGAGRTVSLTGIQAYASAKAGQLGLTRQAAHELGPYGITVNAVAPGFVRSNPATERQWQSYGEAGQRRLVEGLPLRRLGRPEDIAYAVLFLVSDMASWVTGQVLSVDGGSVLI